MQLPTSFGPDRMQPAAIWATVTQVVTMLLSEDQPITDVPTSDYDYHSGGIIETLEGLLGTSPNEDA